MRRVKDKIFVTKAPLFVEKTAGVHGLVYDSRNLQVRIFDRDVIAWRAFWLRACQKRYC